MTFAELIDDGGIWAVVVTFDDGTTDTPWAGSSKADAQLALLDTQLLISMGAYE